MTKITRLAFARKFYGANSGRVFAGGSKPCVVCGKRMDVSPGQIVYSHKECRPFVKKRKLRYGI